MTETEIKTYCRFIKHAENENTTSNKIQFNEVIFF